MMHFILRFSSSMLSNTLAFQREMSLKDQNQALLQVAKTLFTSLGVCGAWCVCVGGMVCVCVCVGRWMGMYRLELFAALDIILLSSSLQR